MNEPSRWLPLVAFTLFPALLIGAPVGAVYLDGPPPGHTGGFGEPTCAVCHFDVPEPDPAGGLVIEGVPEAFTPGERYLLTVAAAAAGDGPEGASSWPPATPKERNGERKPADYARSRRARRFPATRGSTTRIIP